MNKWPDKEEYKRKLEGDLKSTEDEPTASSPTKTITEPKRKLGLCSDKVTVSRGLDHMMGMTKVSENPTGDLSKLGELEEIILDCIIDSIAKDEVLPNPKPHRLSIREVEFLPKIAHPSGPWREVDEDDLRSKTGLKLSGREWEAGFDRLAGSARFSGKFKSFIVDGRYHEIEWRQTPLFPQGFIIVRSGVSTRRKRIPEESKLKRTFLYQLHGPMSLLLRDGIARGRFGVLPKDLYAKRVNWPALRIARYYDLWSGNHQGVDFAYPMLLKLLDLKDVSDVTQRIQQLDRYFNLVADTMHAQLAKRHRGRRTIWNLKNPLLLRPKHV